MFQNELMKKAALFLGGIVLLCLVAWQAPTVIGNVNKSKPQPLTAVPEGTYYFVAWLDVDQLAFIYSPPKSGDRWADRRIGLLTLSTNAWQEIALPSLPDNCSPYSSGVSYVNRLPDGHLGFIQHCHGNAVSGSLYKWDKTTDTVQLLQTYDPPFLVRDYAFAPDMSQLIQENATGAGLNDTLYKVNLTGNYQKISQDFSRARSATWSIDGQQIAFAATAVYAASGQQGWENTEAHLRQPWDIYLMDANGGNLQTLLPSAGNAYALKWSPVHPNLLAFAGDRDNKQGLWLLDTETAELTHIWQQNSRYDWSPAGNQIVLIEQTGQGQGKRTSPVIIDLPNS